MLLALILAAAVPRAAAVELDPPRLVEVEQYLDAQNQYTASDKQLAQDDLTNRRELWRLCVSASKFELQHSRDDPDYVATAILANCSMHEVRVQRAYERSLVGLLPADMRPSLAVASVAKQRAFYHDDLILNLIRQHMQRPGYVPTKSAHHAPQ